MARAKWEIGPVKLIGGGNAFIDAINEGQKIYRYTGRYELCGDWVADGWDDTGRAMYSGFDSPRNLAPPPKKKVRVQRWTVVYFDGSTCIFFEKDRAIEEAKKNGFALLEVDREVEEGEGL